MEFKFEEKDSYTKEDLEGLIKGWKGEVENLITAKDTELNNLKETYKDVDVEGLTKTNHNLSIKNLMLQNDLSEDMIDLIYDEDLDKVKGKINKLKEITKEQKIDESFKPNKNRKSEEQYEKALKDGDIEGSLKYKFSKLFQ